MSTVPRHGTIAGPKNQEATLYVGNLDERAGEPMLRELFVQFAPVVSVALPRDRVTGATLGFAFVELPSAADAEYAMRVLPGVKLFGRPLRVSRAHSHGADDTHKGQHGGAIDVGAHVFVGNLDPERADPSLLASVFSRFGPLICPPEVVPDASSVGKARAHAIVCMSSFEAADAAIAALDGKPLADRVVRVAYAFRKDGPPGERHGSETERRMAAQLRAYSGML